MNEVFEQCKSFDVQIWSDLCKDAYGFRPKFSLENYTAKELDTLWDETVQQLEYTISDDNQEKEVAFASFKNRLNEMMPVFNISMVDAFRWVLQAEGISEDYDHYGIGVVNHHFGMKCDSTYDVKIKNLVFGV